MTARTISEKDYMAAPFGVVDGVRSPCPVPVAVRCAACRAGALVTPNDAAQPCSVCGGQLERVA